jgi:hypothetical protein
MRRSLRESWSRGYFLKPLRGSLRWHAEHSRSIQSTRTFATDTLILDRTLFDRVNPADGLAPDR